MAIMVSEFDVTEDYVNSNGERVCTTGSRTYVATYGDGQKMDEAKLRRLLDSYLHKKHIYGKSLDGVTRDGVVVLSKETYQAFHDLLQSEYLLLEKEHNDGCVWCLRKSVQEDPTRNRLLVFQTEDIALQALRDILVEDWGQTLDEMKSDPKFEGDILTEDDVKIQTDDGTSVWYRISKEPVKTG